MRRIALGCVGTCGIVLLLGNALGAFAPMVITEQDKAERAFIVLTAQEGSVIRLWQPIVARP